MLDEILQTVSMLKITKDFAKFNRRRKKYVLLGKANELNEDQKLEYTRYQLLADLQTKWEQLQRQMPGNMNQQRFIIKQYQQDLNPENQKFILKKKPISHLDSRRYVWVKDFNKLQQLKLNIQPLSEKGFEEFRKFTLEKVRKQSKMEKEVNLAWTVAAEFINYQNRHYMFAEHYYPVLTPPKKVKLNPLVINKNWVTEGKALASTIKAVKAHWSNTAEYSNQEIIGWLLFSGIIYGGINDRLLLEAWLKELITDKARPFINERVYLSIRYEQRNYGNERVEESETIYNTKQVILDLVSQCWLMRYKDKNSNEIDTKNIIKQLSQKRLKQYVFNVLSPVIEPLAIEIPTFTRLLHYASYYWEMLDDVDIDQASVTVLQGRQNHTGLVTASFEQYLDRNYKSQLVQYDLPVILKLSIGSNDDSKKLADRQYSKVEVRKSDLIAKIKRAFELNKKHKVKTPANRLGYKQINPYILDNINYKLLRLQTWKVRLTLNARIIKLCKQYDDLSENILLMWVYDLLNQEKELLQSTIIKYVSTVGYEWLYFTVGQPLRDWTEDDFEELYDEILEYKAIVRGNKDVSYAASRFQQMHKFAESEFGLVSVVIQQTKSNRRVRSELVSPQAYNAIIRQLIESVDILEMEMFVLLFMLVYRTGMRKKELLGLRYIDIEVLSQGQPSVIVRPNKYRSTKTQGSIRRIAIFALLKPQELRFFINYVQSNIGHNPNKFIFTLSNSHQPIDDHVPLQLLRQVLKDISIEKAPPNFTFHAFRHTAVSNLSLVLNGRQDLITALTDYHCDDVLRIKHGLLGEHIEGSDRWYGLSGIMGHLSPQRSFEYYNHIATLMATYELSFANIQLPFKTFNNITGIEKKQLGENNAIIDSDQVSLISIRKLLFKKTIQGIRKSPSFVIEKPTPPNLYDVSTNVSNELFMRYGINRIESFLNASDLSMSLNDAASLANISIDDTKVLARRAYEVTKIVTERGESRFVKLGESGEPLLSPLNIQHQSDFRMLSILQNRVRDLRKDTPEDWQWFIDVCRQKLTRTTASVSFSRSEEPDLVRFIEIAQTMLPAKSWLVSGAQEVISEYDDEKLLKGLRAQYKKAVNTMSVGIAHRDVRINQAKWKFSPLLRYFVHMMMICDEHLTIK